MTTQQTRWTSVAAGLAVAGCLALCALPAAASEHTADEEFEFASKLISYNPSFRDYAQKVVDSLLARDPTQQERSKVIQAEIHIQSRRLAEAEALANEMGGMSNPKAQAIMLSLALAYYNAGEQQKSVELYDAFFKQYGGNVPEDPDVLRFYQDASYIYGQVLEAMGNFAGAAGCYERIEKAAAGNNKDLARDMQLRQAQTWIKAAENSDGDARNNALNKVDEICKKITWGGLDVTFVNAVVVMANARIVRGDPAGATQLLQEYMGNIKMIDEFLKENDMPLSESPMAGARSLLGRLMKEEAQRLEASGDSAAALAKYAEALGEYYNVFVKYGQGPYGANAGLESRAIKEILETKYGKTVKIDLPDTIAAKAAATDFAMGDNLFRRKDWAAAEKEYLRVLSQFPEAGELSVKAVANLLQCYIRQDKTYEAKATADYLAERMNRISPVAAKGVLAAGQLYGSELNNPDMRVWMFETYLKRCPNDPQAGTILFLLATEAEKAKDDARADKLLNQIITEHKDDAQYPRALSKKAWKAYADKDYPAAIQGLATFLKDSQGQPSPLRAQTYFALADCLRRTGREPLAVKQFDALIANLTGPNASRWANGQADIKRNEVLLEQARFWRAFTLTRIEEEAQRRAGIAAFEEFLQLYPSSDLAPKALTYEASAQMALGDPAANDTYARLAREYGNTDEGKNAQYARISGALELKQFDQAREAARAMLSSPDSYSPEEFLRVGNLLLEQDIFQEAAGAFEQAVRKAPADNRSLLERGYFGLGKSKHGMKDDKGAAEAMNELMTRWPKSSLFYDAQFVLAEASYANREFDAAKDAINSILRYANKPSIDNQASLLMADIQLAEDPGEKGKRAAALTYQRLEYINLLNMPSALEREQMRGALLKSMALEEELQDWDRLLETCEAFIENFPMAAELKSVQDKRNVAKLRLEASVATGAGNEAGGEE